MCPSVQVPERPGAQDPLKLYKLQVVVSHLRWVLGNKLGSFARTGGVLKH